MINKLPILGLTSAHIVSSLKNKYQYNYETRSLIESASKFYENILLINPFEVSIDMVEDEKISMHMKDVDLSNLTTLFIRGTNGVEIPIRAIVNVLSFHGCDIVDPLSRFAGTKASKLITTIQRHRRGVGSTSYFAFGLDEAFNVIKRINNKGHYPIISKPIYGKHGKGVIKINNIDEAYNHVNSHFVLKPNEPLFFQKWNNFIKEYRALVIHGKCIGIAEKIKKNNSLVLNAMHTNGFKIIHDNTLKNYVLNNVSSDGLIGVDIGLTDENTYQIIEANRAPEWVEFEKAMGLNVSNIIMEEIYIKSLHYNGKPLNEL